MDNSTFDFKAWVKSYISRPWPDNKFDNEEPDFGNFLMKTEILTMAPESAIKAVM